MQGSDLQCLGINLFSQANLTEAAMSNVKAMAFAQNRKSDCRNLVAISYYSNCILDSLM